MSVIISLITSIKIIDNHALVNGGGIYTENECVRPRQFCFYQTIDQQCNTETVHVIMENNTADYAGDHIYGGVLEKVHNKQL